MGHHSSSSLPPLPLFLKRDGYPFPAGCTQNYSLKNPAHKLCLESVGSPLATQRTATVGSPLATQRAATVGSPLATQRTATVPLLWLIMITHYHAGEFGERLGQAVTGSVEKCDLETILGGESERLYTKFFGTLLKPKMTIDKMIKILRSEMR